MDGAAAFFGRPRFLTPPLLVPLPFGLALTFFAFELPGLRPRFFGEAAAFDGAREAGAFFGEALAGRPRDLFAGDAPEFIAFEVDATYVHRIVLVNFSFFYWIVDLLVLY